MTTNLSVCLDHSVVCIRRRAHGSIAAVNSILNKMEALNCALPYCLLCRPRSSPLRVEMTPSEYKMGSYSIRPLLTPHHLPPQDLVFPVVLRSLRRGDLSIPHTM